MKRLASHIISAGVAPVMPLLVYAGGFDVMATYLSQQTAPVEGTEELWYGKFIRVSKVDDAGITFSTNADRSRITVNNVWGGLTDMVFYDYNAAATTTYHMCLADVQQYTFNITGDDGAVSARTLWAQKIERDTYDCYTVAYYACTQSSDGVNQAAGANSLFIHSATVSADFADKRDLSIYAERTRFQFYICAKGTLDVTEIRDAFGCNFKSFIPDTHMTDVYTPAGGTPLSRDYHIQCVGKDTTRTTMQKYPDYVGKLDIVNFNNKGRAYRCSWISNGSDAGLTGHYWWTATKQTHATWSVEQRKVWFPKQNTRAEVVIPTPVTQNSVVPVGIASRTEGTMAFREVRYGDDADHATFGASNGIYWYTPIGAWGQMVTGLITAHFDDIDIASHHADGDVLLETLANTTIYTLHRVNITPYVPIVIQSYGYGNYNGQWSQSIYVNGYFDTASAFNYDIIDRCDLYVLPGNYTKALSSAGTDFLDIDKGNVNGVKLTGVPQYQTDYAGTLTKTGTTRVDPVNDATHFNLLFPCDAMPIPGPNTFYSFYLKAYFKPEHNLQPIFMSLTPRAQKNVTTGLDYELSIDAENQIEPTYYDLQGRLISQPVPGTLVIRRQGPNAEKIILGQ